MIEWKSKARYPVHEGFKIPRCGKNGPDPSTGSGHRFSQRIQQSVFICVLSLSKDLWLPDLFKGDATQIFKNYLNRISHKLYSYCFRPIILYEIYFCNPFVIDNSNVTGAGFEEF